MNPMVRTCPAAGWLGTAFLICLMAAGSSEASAHRGHGCWTELTWADDRFEIVHRIHLADAITVLRQLDPDAVIDSVAGQAQLALYMEARFAIESAAGPARLDTIGAEIADDFLLVYQEWQTTLPAAMPSMSNRALLEIDSGAQHFVRYDTGDSVETRQLLRD